MVLTVTARFFSFYKCIAVFCIKFPTILEQRFSNWGPRTKGGPRRVPMGSAKGFRKVVIVCTFFLTIYDPYIFKFANISQSLSLSALRGSVAVVWLSVDVS